MSEHLYEIKKIKDYLNKFDYSKGETPVLLEFELKHLTAYLNNIDKEIKQLKNKLQQRDNIIKEVREYIENPRHEMSVNTYQGILEILDKVEEK